MEFAATWSKLCATEESALTAPHQNASVCPIIRIYALSVYAHEKKKRKKIKRKKFGILLLLVFHFSCAGWLRQQTNHSIAAAPAAEIAKSGTEWKNIHTHTNTLGRSHECIYLHMKEFTNTIANQSKENESHVLLSECMPQENQIRKIVWFHELLLLRRPVNAKIDVFKYIGQNRPNNGYSTSLPLRVRWICMLMLIFIYMHVNCMYTLKIWGIQRNNTHASVWCSCTPEHIQFRLFIYQANVLSSISMKSVRLEYTR